jgi:hypothetical protein
MNKQRKIVFVGATATIMMLTSLLSYHPTTVMSESVVYENVSNRFNIESYKEKLISNYNDILIKKQIDDKEKTYKYLINNKGNNEVKVINKSKKIKKKPCNKYKYSNDDLILLAGIIQNEAGSSFCSDLQQKCVASVIINRTKSKYYPNSIYKVIFQKHQYDIRENFNHPTKRSIKNAKYVLINGSILPNNCIFQSEFKQGDGVYKKFKTPISTTYICYKN